MFLLTQRSKQWRHMSLPADRQYGVGGYVPGFPCKESAFNLSCGTIVAHGALRYTMQTGKLRNRDIIHAKSSYRQVLYIKTLQK